MSEIENAMKNEIKTKLPLIVEELLEKSKLREGQVLALGCSSSEILGHSIGSSPTLWAGKMVVETILEILRPRGIYLAVQGCEHINRSLVVERELATKLGLAEVTVVPTYNAGGSACMSAYALAEDPVVVEGISADAGLDIGDTSIGQYVRFVQIPLRLSLKSLGQAHITGLSCRPRLVGGKRAIYEFNREYWEEHGL